MKKATEIKKVTTAAVKTKVEQSYPTLEKEVAARIESLAKLGHSSFEYNLVSIYPTLSNLPDSVKSKIVTKLSTKLRKQGFTVKETKWHSYSFKW